MNNQDLINQSMKGQMQNWMNESINQSNKE